MKQVETVEALRGLAALAVALFHFTNGNPTIPGPGLMREAGSHGWLGVEVFFVISGFVIALSMSRRNYRLTADAPRFVAKRLVRLEPPYLLAVLLSILLLHLSSTTSAFAGSESETTVAQVLLHLAYLAALFDEAWLNPVFWTLAIEFQFYLAVTVIYPLLAAPGRWLRIAAMFALLLVPHLVDDNRLVPFWFGLFGFGLLVWLRQSGRIDRATLLILLAVCFVSNVYRHSMVIALVTLAATAALLLIQLRRYAVLAYLGAVSYSFYLLHVPIGGRVINLMGRLEPGAMRDVLAVVGALLASLVAATALYYLVERPSKRLSAKISYGRKQHPPS